MTNSCLAIDALLDDLSDDAQAHLAACSTCRDLAQDVASVRSMAQALPADGWAGGSAPSVDVEAALANVLAGTRPARARPVRVRPRARPLLLRLASSLAAAAVLLSIAAPSLLRWRIEAAPAQSETVSGLQGLEARVFWTTVGAR